LIEFLKLFRTIGRYLIAFRNRSVFRNIDLRNAISRFLTCFSINNIRNDKCIDDYARDQLVVIFIQTIREGRRVTPISIDIIDIDFACIKSICIDIVFHIYSYHDKPVCFINAQYDTI